ncbi:unannotated protein [freshwater metagenome]|uniref:Unannotated protein n=1 Tax=freshwater metagenome TaxID=449393 RepID=A0A6J7EWU3_9ZZZZ|nr:MarR family transcriptional regulator [Actinomycetota bacterium]
MAAPKVHPLNTDEEVVWRALTHLLVVLRRSLGDDLERLAGIGGTDYVVLMSLSEAPRRQLRMSDLARRCDLSASRITRLVDALSQQGLVVKERAIGDARSNLATLTDAGYRRLRETYPVHLANVRHRVFDHLSAEEVALLGPILERITSGLEPKGEA